MTQPVSSTISEHREMFIDAMSRAVTTVAVVTTTGATGALGLTVSSLSSVSADPPTLLICINRRNPIAEAILANGVFGASVLRADQRRIAEVFAGRPRQGAPYDFSVAGWGTIATGSPLLAGAVARFDCQVEQSLTSGTHVIITGLVLAASSGEGTPLLYGRREFGEVRAMPRPAGEPGRLEHPVWDEMTEEKERFE